MTMLEALVALVILGASAAGFLGVFQSGARSMQSAAEWNRATAVAESVLEEAVRAKSSGEAADFPADGMARIDERPWSANVDEVTVRILLPDGRSLTVHRLVRRR
jgi:type II secretory pathway pseudopilin PulG